MESGLVVSASPLEFVGLILQSFGGVLEGLT